MHLPPKARAAGILAPVAVILLHALLTFYNLPPRVVFSGQPVTSFDYDTHYGQVKRVSKALEWWGKTWAWDPQLLAGFPGGVIFDADNKGCELFVHLLNLTGIDHAAAFNLFVLVVHLLVPLFIYLACSLFGAGRGASTFAALLASALWCFDSTTRRMWWGGMIGYAGASYASVLALALFWRFLENGKVRFALLLALLLPAVHLVHPYAFFILLFPMTTAYVMRMRRLHASRHLMVAAACATTLLVNLFWMLDALRFREYWIRFNVKGIADFWYFLADYLGIVAITDNTAHLGARSGWRFAVWAAAFLGLLRWRRERDGKFLPFTVAAVWLFGTSLLGKYSKIVSELQPARHLVPLTFFALVPAADHLRHLYGQWVRERAPAALRDAAIILAVAALAYLSRDAVYFMPSLKVSIERMAVGPPNNSEAGAQEGRGPLFRHAGPREDVKEVGRWVRSRDDGSGRFLVHWWVLGEYLTWSTGAQVMGGIRHRNLVHARSNIFLRHFSDPPPKRYLSRYIKRYAIKYLIVSGALQPIEKQKDLLEGHDFIPPFHRIYLTDRSPSWFEKGSGKVKASLNRIEVKGASGDEVVLKYHYLETMACRPGCSVERAEAGDDPVGFIKVKNPPRDFVIENTYRR